HKFLKGFSHVPAILAMMGACAIALGTLWAFHTGATVPHRLPLFEWIHIGNFQVDVAFWIDQLTAIYLTFVTGIGLLIFIYASGYMKGDYGYFRFFAFLSIFVFFMTMLVLADNFALLYLGWEGVGLSSYLLIGYYYPRPSAVAAAKKAFITNRVGDFGFAIGIFLIFLTFGTVNFGSNNVHIGVLSPSAIAEAGKAHATWMYWIPFLLMVGAFGKSAQFPLHVWLPDAMEGPTPVSALIHAATIVTAGVYMIARCLPLFNPDALMVVACIGGFTAFLAASIALCQYDLKRIWAYSTLSQLGYMVLGLGVAASTSAVFHVFTHAFFKALLFLAAGSVMHAMGGELDIRKMSGVKKVMPITMVLMLIGCLALAGFPGLAGFFSKDQIIAAAINHPGPMGWVLGLTALLVALMTAYYTFRLFFRVFMGPLQLPATAGHHEPSPFAIADEHGHGGHEDHGSHDAHDSHGDHGSAAERNLDGPFSMWGPLVILALGAIFAGYLDVGHGEAHGWFHAFLAPVLGNPGAAEGAAAEGGETLARVSESVLFGLSILLPVAGIAIAAYFHWANRHAATILAANLRPIQKFLENKWYIDEIYEALLLKPLWILGHACSLADRFVIDGAVFLIGFAPQLLGYSIRPSQRGLLQRYAVGMVAGVIAIVLGVLYVLWK
ncbi:MAG: NADH-quinone oxidoreductase subunit L, partial [Phycisphaerae bacterium]